MRRIEVQIAICSENKGHVADAFAVRHSLRIKRNMHGRRIVMVLKKENDPVLDVSIIPKGGIGRRT